jgi:hypothetical protein
MKCAAEKLRYSLLTVTLKSGVTIVVLTWAKSRRPIIAFAPGAVPE